jgi:hypothetical protein
MKFRDYISESKLKMTRFNAISDILKLILGAPEEAADKYTELIYKDQDQLSNDSEKLIKKITSRLHDITFDKVKVKKAVNMIMDEL